MHYKDGTKVEIGDVAKHDDGSVVIILGGQIGSDYCTTQVVAFRPANSKITSHGHGAGYLGTLRKSNGEIVSRNAVKVDFNEITQTREMVKIGHVDLGDVQDKGEAEKK